MLGEISQGSREEVQEKAKTMTGYKGNQLEVYGEKLYDFYAEHSITDNKYHKPTLIKEYYLIKRDGNASDIPPIYDHRSDKNELYKWEDLPPQWNWLDWFDEWFDGYDKTVTYYVKSKLVRERIKKFEEKKSNKLVKP